MDKTIKIIIFVSVLILVIILVLIAYFNLRSIIKQEDFSRILKCCFAALGSEFKTKLVIGSDKPLNSLLAEYLTNNDLSIFKKICKILTAEIKRYQKKEITQPGLIMKTLFILLISEQLNEKYVDGFTFEESKFNKLEKDCPFVFYYCVIVKIENKYFTDVLEGKIFPSFEPTVNSSFDKIMAKINKNGYSDPNLIRMPQKVVSVYLSLDQEYLIELANYSYLKVALVDGRAYSVCAFIIRNGCNSNYKVKGGDKLTKKDSLKLKNKFRTKDKSFLSVSVISKTQSYL